MRGEFKVGGPGARAGLGGRDPPSIRGLGLSQQEGGLPPSGRTQQGRRGGTLGGGGWERWGEAGAALTTGSGTAAWPRPLGPDPLLRSGRAGEAGRGIHTWRLAWPPTCHLRPGAGPGLAPEGPIAGARGGGAKAVNQNGDFFWRRRRQERGARAGRRARRGGSGRGGGAAGGGFGAAPPPSARGVRVGGAASARAAPGSGPGARPGAYLRRPAGRRRGGGRGRDWPDGGAGAGSGRRRLRAALRTCALPPLPPLTVLLWGGGANSRGIPAAAPRREGPVRGWGARRARGLVGLRGPTGPSAGAPVQSGRLCGPEGGRRYFQTAG